MQKKCTIRDRSNIQLVFLFCIVLVFCNVVSATSVTDFPVGNSKYIDVDGKQVYFEAIGVNTQTDSAFAGIKINDEYKSVPLYSKEFINFTNYSVRIDDFKWIGHGLGINIDFTIEERVEYTPVCGDNVCDATENTNSCPEDCCTFTPKCTEKITKECTSSTTYSISTPTTACSGGCEYSSSTAMCNNGYYCEGIMYGEQDPCNVCSTNCDGICQSGICYNIDPDCNSEGEAMPICCENNSECKTEEKQSCSTICDSQCNSKDCYGTDPDCNTSGNANNKCCGNSICESGEDYDSCPSDCTTPSSKSPEGEENKTVTASGTSIITKNVEENAAQEGNIPKQEIKEKPDANESTTVEQPTKNIFQKIWGWVRNLFGIL